MDPRWRRAGIAFGAGLVAGYVISGFVLGPGVLAVLVGIAVGAVAAFALNQRPRE